MATLTELEPEVREACIPTFQLGVRLVAAVGSLGALWEDYEAAVKEALADSRHTPAHSEIAAALATFTEYVGQGAAIAANGSAWKLSRWFKCMHQLARKIERAAG